MIRGEGRPAGNQARHARQARLLLFIILGLALVRGVIYASVVPVWQTPDEPKHFEYVALLYEKGRLVTEDDISPGIQRQILDSMKASDYWRWGYANSRPETTTSFWELYKMSPSELARPPLYYLAALPFYALASGLPIEGRLYVLRLLSVLLGVLTVLMTFLTVRTVLPADPLTAALAAIFVIFVPMHSFISGSVNSDNLANAIAATVGYLLARTFMAGASFRRAAGLIALLIAGVWTKRTTLFAIPLTAVSMIVYTGGNYLGKHTRRMLAGAGAGVMVFAASLVLLEQPRAVVRWLLDNYVFNVSAEANLSGFTENRYTVAGLLELYHSFIGHMFDSFWAQFGWMNLRLDDIWYVVLLLFCLLGLAGLVRFSWFLYKNPDVMAAPQRKLTAMYLIWILLILGITLLQYTADYNPRTYPQGRYLFTALTPIAFFFALGIKNLLPGRFQASALYVAVSFFFVFDSLSLGLYILPFYYPPA